MRQPRSGTAAQTTRTPADGPCDRGLGQGGIVVAPQVGLPGTCRHDSIISGSGTAVAVKSGEHWRRMRGITISSCGGWGAVSGRHCAMRARLACAVSPCLSPC
eukprot:scaffold22470_cov91-Isochrysis_galbana.AAC.3